MGEIRLSVDPKAIDKELVQSWIDQLNSLPNVKDFLTAPKDIDVFVTDNQKSFTSGNQSTIKNTPGIAGLAQSEPKAGIWLDPNHRKAHVKTLVHEVLHHKYPGLAGTNNQHKPEFYNAVGKALNPLALNPIHTKT
jgi:hypothetical protein